MQRSARAFAPKPVKRASSRPSVRITAHPGSMALSITANPLILPWSSSSACVSEAIHVGELVARMPALTNAALGYVSMRFLDHLTPRASWMISSGSSPQSTQSSVRSPAPVSAPGCCERSPGIGDLLALTITAEIGDVSRFASARRVIGYAGLAPTIKQLGRASRPA
jgi:hypothetical protein